MAARGRSRLPQRTAAEEVGETKSIPSLLVRLSYYGEGLDFLLGELYPYIHPLSNP